MKNDTSCSSGSSIYSLAMVFALAVFGAGVYLTVEHQTWAVLAAGCVAIVAVLAAWPLTASISAAAQEAEHRHHELMTSLNDRLQQVSVMMNVATEQQLLSDRAKAVAFRDKDREALRRAINEDLARKDYEGANVLANEMEAVFGYKHEADRFREEIAHRRLEGDRSQVTEAASRIEDFCRQEKWTDALREAERIITACPEVAKEAALYEKIEEKRQIRKRQLLDEWRDATARNDVDSSIDILRKLDLYLTRAEAETMQVDARNVFKEKLHNLRVQFTLAVQDRKWTEAIRTGELIVRDFPNSGIAREVREKLDVLRKRAIEPAGASA